MTEISIQKLAETVTQALRGQKWRAYGEYKDSGIEWLEKVPKHWEVRRLAMAVQKITNGYVGPTRDILVNEGIRYLQSLHVKNGIIRFDKPYYVTEEWSKEHSKSILREGDVVIVQTGDVGQCCAIPKNFENCNCHALIIVQIKSNLGSGFYLSAFLRSHYGINALRQAQTGALHPHLECGKVREIPILIPSLSEQRSITTFLNHQTARIDALIAKKEQHIALLQEKRAALISHAVTKGLNADVPMKDSGVEWLGMVPEHWGVRRLKFVASFTGGGTPSKEIPEYWTGNIPWISPKDMKTDEIVDTEEHITEEAIVNSATHVIQPGTVLIVVRSGILRHTIPVAINTVPATINQDMKAITLQALLQPKYLANLIRGYQSALLVAWRKQGATVESIEFELLANTLYPVPPLSEQQTIIAYLDKETQKIDALISTITEGIKKLKEYRTALISAAVTGKIDVRGAVAEEPGVIEGAAD